MVRHLLRDYATQTSNTSTSTFIGSYLTALFLRRTLLYTYVGDTNYPINNTGTLLISTADSTPIADTPNFAGGTKAGINLGLNKEFNVSIPSGTHTVAAADVGRVLVLRSTTNPTFNSGCFAIDGYDTGTNSYQVDYRSGTSLSGPTTTIAVGSNGLNLPQSTINVASTTSFPASGTLLITTSTGVQVVTYTSTNATQFLTASGGTGTMSTGNLVLSAFTLPQATLNVVSTTGFPSSGSLFVYSTAGRQTVPYTGITGTSFTGCTLGTGTVGDSTTYPIIANFNTTIAAGSNGQSLPQAVINVASTMTATTTIAAGSNNVYLPRGTINIAAVTGFPTTNGTIYVTTDAGIQLVTYTTASGTTFTGCSSGLGKMTTGGTVYAGFAPVGTVFVTTATGVQQVSYTGTTSTTFTGCSGGTGSMTTGNSVYYSPSVPPIEPSDSINWYLYEKDSGVSILAQGTANGNLTTQYRGNGTSTTPRIILQSPHPLGWQVRICHETPQDCGVGTGGTNTECALITMCPGFGGNGSGDFAVGGPHLHVPLFYNSSNATLYQGGALGFGDNVNIPSGSTSMLYRITMVGDDDGYGIMIFGRRPGDVSTPRSYFVGFGVTQNEQLPLQPNNESRLYVLGSGLSTGSGNSLNDMSWFVGNTGSANSQGVSIVSSFANVENAIPTTANTSMITYAVGVSQGGSPIFDGSAGDSPWTSGIELFGVDIISGVFNSWTGQASFANFGFPILEARFLGTMPHIREGRANFSEFTTTADYNHSFQHMRRGMYIFWGGPPVIT